MEYNLEALRTQASREVQELKETFSSSLNHLQNDLEYEKDQVVSLERRNTNLESQVLKLNEISLKADQLENQNILLLNKIGSLEKLNLTQTQEKDETIKKLDLKVKEQALKISELEAQIKQDLNLQQQLEQLRSLFEESSLKIEKLELKNAQLERLNKNLSLKLALND